MNDRFKRFLLLQMSIWLFVGPISIFMLVAPIYIFGLMVSVGLNGVGLTIMGLFWVLIVPVLVMSKALRPMFERFGRAFELADSSKSFELSIRDLLRLVFREPVLEGALDYNEIGQNDQN